MAQNLMNCGVRVANNTCLFVANPRRAHRGWLCAFHASPEGRDPLGRYKIHPQYYEELSKMIMPLLLEAMKQK